MTEAVIECAKIGTPPPLELTLAIDAQTFSALPYAGGLLDQPAGLIKRMKYALLLYNAWVCWLKRIPGKESEWVESYPSDWKIIQETM